MTNRHSLIPNPGILVPKFFICKWMATAFHTKATNPVKGSSEKLPGEETRQEVGRVRKINTIKRNGGKTWGGKGGLGDGRQPFAGVAMLIPGAVEG